jgi:hypothetical protein
VKRGPAPGQNAPKVSADNAKAAWGAAMPDWIGILAAACDRSSQSMVAKQLGYSSSVISSVLRRNYVGSLETVEKAVRGALMAETLNCPVLAEIATHECLANQKRAREFSAGSSIRVRLYRACRGPCPHSRIAGGGSHAQ